MRVVQVLTLVDVLGCQLVAHCAEPAIAASACVTGLLSSHTAVPAPMGYVTLFSPVMILRNRLLSQKQDRSHLYWIGDDLVGMILGRLVK